MVAVCRTGTQGPQTLLSGQEACEEGLLGRHSASRTLPGGAQERTEWEGPLLWQSQTPRRQAAWEWVCGEGGTPLYCPGGTTLLPRLGTALRRGVQVGRNPAFSAPPGRCCSDRWSWLRTGRGGPGQMANDGQGLLPQVPTQAAQHGVRGARDAPSCSWLRWAARPGPRQGGASMPGKPVSPPFLEQMCIAWCAW